MDHQTLSTTQPLDGTLQYNAALKDLIDKQDLLTIVGALLIQEYAIPEEFKRIRVGRDLVFPDQFVLQPDDEYEVRRQKGFARLYIDHHIAHDTTSHYPDLEQAIIKYANDPQALAKIFKGMEIISQAKQAFYKSLEHIQQQ